MSETPKQTLGVIGRMWRSLFARVERLDVEQSLMNRILHVEKRM